MIFRPRAPQRRVIALALATLPSPLLATEAPDPGRDIVVTAQKQANSEQSPATTASVTAAQIDTVINGPGIEDALKYLPSLLVRKRNIGDQQAPLATRTSGVGASARSLIYADGALLSALIGNNNSSASPRWALVSPQEVDRIDVLYGPFSAAYPGNSIGAVVNITTRLPDKLEGTVTSSVNVQTFDQYATAKTLPGYEIGGTIGDRFGPLAFFASARHVTNDSQPLAYTTATRVTAPGATQTTGGFDDFNRTDTPIRVLGAGGFEHQGQDFFKVKAALDVTSAIRLTYVGGLFLNQTESSAETYLSSAAGAPVYAGNLAIGGFGYAVPASSFANNVYRTDQRHWSHSLSATGSTGPVDWQVIGTLFDFAKDSQRIAGTALPGALSGGAGTITRLDGTGWSTVDAKAAWHGGGHILSVGYHHDRYTLASNRYATSDWRTGQPGALTLAAAGRTQTDALWVQDAWTIAEPLTLTIGGRQEWWRASNGSNFSASPAFLVNQPSRSTPRFSPKASLRWAPAVNWAITASFGAAYRFPTVTELYQAITTGPSITSPNPTLRPERALSEELAAQYGGQANYVRLSLFSEALSDALLSQSAPLVPGSTTLYSYVQNVDRVRTRGIELAVVQTNLLSGFDLSGSLTLIDPRITADTAFPDAIGKRPPQLPLRKATIVATWHPARVVALTAAVRFATRSFGTINNVDSNPNTYQGFGGYAVVDLRAVFRVNPQWQMAFGVDNVGNDKYFLFHPFPQRSFSAELTYRL
ncbi:MAG: TonB-dependent receptor [Sphingomonas sp. 28-63-12]|nr:MAG: TonB-dependent receptor [Sphingomonas sp. 28-63-12]